MKMKILYVEDNPLDSDLTLRELSKTSPQMQLEMVGTVGEALVRLEGAEQFDLALIDMILPDGNGLDLLAAIRRQKRPLAVVIITGQGDEASAVAALKAGADDYIVKQNDYLARLPLTLEDALHRFRAQRTQHVRPLRVLYVEHHAVDIDLTQRHFDQHAVNIRLTAVNSADAGLAKLSDGEWDVLLLDYRLPGMNALEMVKIVRQERGSQIPIVLVTGQGDEETALTALKLGASDYVTKNQGYLYQLPGLLENAYHHARLIREQAALRESEQRYQALFDHAPDAILLADPETGLIVDANHMAEIMLDRPLAEIIGLHQSALHPPEATTYSRKTFANHAAQSAPGKTLPIENKILRPDGSQIPVEVQAQNVVINGRTLLQGVFRDITERKQAEEEIKKLSKVIETTSQFIVITDIEGTVIYVNAAYVNISGYAKEEVVGGSMFEFSSENGVIKLQSEIIPALLSTGHWRGEMTVKRKDGAIFPAELICSLLASESGEPEYFVAVFFDITQRVQAKLELQELNAELDERVRDRTADLNQLVQMMAGREVRMAELKQVIKKLRKQLQVAGLKPIADDPLSGS